MTPSNKRGVAFNLDRLLRPIMIFAAVVAPLCWIAAWFFWEWREFSALFLALGALPIVVAVCAYLYLLVNKIERG